jgi:hypothetical protein
MGRIKILAHVSTCKKIHPEGSIDLAKGIKYVEANLN